MKMRLVIFLCLFLLGIGLIGGYRYYLQSQTPSEDPNYIKELAPKLDPETGAVVGTPPV